MRIAGVYRVIVELCCLLILTLIGCSSSTVPNDRKPIQEYEGEFDPSKYSGGEDETATAKDPSKDELPYTESKEQVVTIQRIEQRMGYRVQIFSTTSFDDADRRKGDYKELLGDSVTVNIVFDAPYYKIRIGDFVEKTAATAECARLKEFGLEEAWVVRDKVNHVITETLQKN